MTELIVERREEMAFLTLNRPAARNALTPSLLDAIIETCATLRGEDAIRVVILRGAGRTFSGGADLPAFLTRLGAGDPHEAADLGRRAADAVAGLPQITVAAIEGHCVGGGVVLAAACDLRWAAPASSFCIPELEIGIPLAWGALPRLVALLGESVALDLVLTCRRFDAEEALGRGFVSALVEVEEMEARIAAIAAHPAVALRTTKRQLRAIRAGSFDADADAAALLAALSDPESQAAAQRYMMRRKKKPRG